MKHEIEIEGLPEGWEIDKITLPSSLFTTANQVQYGTYIKLKKKQPRRIVLEETGEVRDTPKLNHYNYFYTDHEGFDRYKVAREVNETDPSLHNADDKESLRLSVDECRKLLCNLDKDVMRKLQQFLKDK